MEGVKEKEKKGQEELEEELFVWEQDGMCFLLAGVIHPSSLCCLFVLHQTDTNIVHNILSKTFVFVAKKKTSMNEISA